MSLNIIKLNTYTDKALTKVDNDYSDFNKNYILSIQISLDGFLFCITDEERSKLIALETYAIQEIEDYEILSKDLSDLIDNLEILKKRFNRVNVIFEGTKAALIPFPLYDENSIESYLKFNHKLKHGEEILSDKLNTLQAYNVYYYSYVYQRFDQSKIYQL